MGEAESTTETFAALPAAARAYLAAALVLAIAGTVFAAGSAPPFDWALLAVAIGLCAAGAAFEVYAPGHYALQPSFAFFFWGAVLLGPWGIVALAVASFAPAARRAPRHKTAFNVANYVIAGLAAWSAFQVVAAGRPELTGLAMAAVGATLVNHGLLAGMVGLATGTVPREQLTETAPLSLGVALTGACLAVLWLESGPLVALGLGPLVLVTRSLYVPMLRHRANTEPKTGLLHLDAFKDVFAGVREAARRARRPVSVAMIDLDRLREINNRRGHLAGDLAIRGLADGLRAVCPPDAHAARFGGEEFCLLLPGFTAEAARELLGELREHLRGADLRESPDAPRLRVTFSAGVACFPEHGSTLTELLAAADEAAYDAKAAGRDRVRVARSSFTTTIATAADLRLRELATGRVPVAGAVDS